MEVLLKCYLTNGIICFLLRFNKVYYICLNKQQILDLDPHMSKRLFYTKYIQQSRVRSLIILKERNSIRIKVLKRPLFNELKRNLCYDHHLIDTNEYMFGEEWGGIDNNPGVSLATIGSYSIDNIAGGLNFQFIRQLNSAYKSGHCRKRCDKVGMATYRTARGTNRVHPRPTIDENEIGYHQYYSHINNKSHLVQFVTESVAKKLGQSALEFGTREHYPLFKHIADTCDMTIITSGVPSFTQIAEFEKNSTKTVMNKRPFVSFACTSHND